MSSMMGGKGKKRKVGSIEAPSRSSSRKNPKRAARVLADSYFNTTVIKCTLNPLTRFAVVANEVRECVETMAVVFYHTHLAMLLLLARNEGRLVLRGETVSDNKMQSMWDTMARVMYRCLHGQDQYGTANTHMYDHCRDYCVDFDLFGSLRERQLGWYTKVLEELAKRSATIHKTHLDTNLHIYAQRYIHVLIATDDRFETIKGLKTADLNKVVSAVTYGDDEKTQKETVQTVIARRPSTRAEYDKACKAIAEAEKIGNQAALLKAEAKKAEALHPEHAAWTEAEVLRAEWRKLVAKGTYSEKSERVFFMLKHCREHGQTLQEQVRQAAAAGVANKKSTQGPKRKKRKWTFTLCPVLEYAPPHVPINSTTVRELFAHVAKDHPHIKELLDQTENAEEELGEDATDHARNFLYWDALFNVRKPFRKKFFERPDELRFGNYIQTDGVGVSLTIQKRKSEVEIQKMELARKIKAREIKAREELQATRFPELKELREAADAELAWTLEIAESALDAATDADAELVRLKDEKKELDKRTKKPKDHQYIVSEELVGKLQSQLENVGDNITVKPGCDVTVRAIDPGKKAIGTWVEQSGDKHGDEDSEQEYKHGDVSSGEWIFMSGQKQYTKKMTKRTKEGCPEWSECPSLKTEVDADLVEAIRFRVALLPVIRELRFKKLWLQKQRMRKFVKRQRALETVVARFCGTANKVKQKENVVIALGDADMRGNMRGLPPVMSTTWVKHLMRCTMVVMVNEFRTSKLCCGCHEVMHQQKNCFRVKRCINSDCSRGFWNRDVNAAINILNMFLWAVRGNCNCSASSKSRPEVFRREKGCDE